MEPPADVSPAQKRIAYAALVFVTVLSGISIAAEVELFPFSYFPMFSNLHDARDPIRTLKIVGLVGNEQHEFTGKEVRSFTRTTVRVLYRYVKHLRWTREALVLYERWRVAEAAQAPRLDGIQVYFYDRVLRPWAENRDEPDRRQLLIEVRRKSPTG